MAKKSIIQFPFPLGGLDRSVSYRAQPPYTTTDMLNVRAYETIEGRARGGQRPGLVKAFAEELGDGSPLRMLAQVTSVGTTAGGYYYYWSDEFNRDGSDLGPGWNDATWWPTLLQSPTKIVIGGALVERQTSASVRDQLEFSTAYPYLIEVRIVPYGGQHWGDYWIFARMDDDDPEATDEGIIAQITLTGDAGAYSGRLTSFSGGLPTLYAFTPGSTGSATAGWFKVLVNADNIQCSWQDQLLVSADIAAHSGKRIGFRLSTIGTYPTGLCLADVIRVQGTPVGGLGTQRRRTYLVASAGTKIYADRTIGEMSEISGVAARLSDKHLVLAAEHHQKLYIADWDPPRIIGTSGTIDATGLQLTHPGEVTDWTSYGIDADNDVVVISDGLGLVVDGTYQIDSVAASMVTLAASAGGAGTCTYRIERAPKVYDPAENTVSIWAATATQGQVPTGCHLICTYRDRMILAGPDDDPHIWFASRSGDAYDWDYLPEDPTDAGRAVSGANSDAGKVGDVITALIPFSDDFLVFGCKGSLWVMRGDPAWGGTLDALSYDVGIVGAKSWCQGPSGEFYFLSADGLYRLPPGATGRPEPLSTEKLPHELMRLNPATHEVLLEWDDQQKGVHIYLAPIAAGAVGSYVGLGSSPEASPSPSPEPQ